jgi:hypothetical protein
MSAKITVIVYILICLVVGILLLVLPWTPYWNDNFFLDFIRSRLHASWLTAALQSGYGRGAVSGLGALNILAGLRDAFKFRESVSLLTAWESPPSALPLAPVLTETGVTSSSTPAADLPDHQPPQS